MRKSAWRASDERLNPVTVLPAPSRIPCRLTSGNRQPGVPCERYVPLAQDVAGTSQPGRLLVPASSGQVADSELRGGDSGLGEQSGRGGLVRGHGEGGAAADGGAVVPCRPGQVYGPGAVRAHGTAVPLHCGAPAGPGLVEQALHAAFGGGFPLVRGARGGYLDELIPGR